MTTNPSPNDHVDMFIEKLVEAHGIVDGIVVLSEARQLEHLEANARSWRNELEHFLADVRDYVDDTP